jgi:hypothetical protein
MGDRKKSESELKGSSILQIGHASNLFANKMLSYYCHFQMLNHLHASSQLDQLSILALKYPWTKKYSQC